jgi:tetratricopeptide (TPR) repeat protein
MMQDYVFAETCLKQALELSENDPHLHVNLGWLHLIQGHVSMAIGELTVALSLNDKQPKAHNNCGLCHIENSNYPQAIKHFRRALSQNPDLGQINYQLGCAHLLNRDVEDAIKDWELSTKAEPQFPDGFANLGVAYYKKKTYDKALAAFRRVLALRTTRMEDWSNAGLTYGKQGMELKALSKKPGDTKHKESMERHRLAVEMFDAALAIHPTNPQLHSNRGLACFFANMPEQAMYEWSMVTKLDPSYAKRRGKALQSEFDDSAIDFIPVNTSERAMSHTPRTPGYLSRYAYGYDTNQWVLMIEDPELAELAELSKEVRNLERIANAL